MEHFLRRAIYILIIPVVLLSGACSSDNNDPQPGDEQFLISSELVYATTAQQLKLLIQFSGIDVDPNALQYDIEIYKVVYNTDYDGGSINASGLIAVPKTNEAVGMLSFHHGTITNRDDAPSNFSASDYNAVSYAAMASVGFIGVIPDYLGFGTSSSILHPYYVEDLTASSILDMLKAATELAQQKSVQFNSKLFLAGYSEGGYATMAVHKAIEENPLDDFTLVASFPGAGGYDLKGMQEYIFEQPEYDDPHYIAYMARAYQIHYEKDNLLTDFFKEPYASRIPGLFDGQKGADAINAQLTPIMADLIQADLLSNIDTDADYQYLVDAFNENSLIDWTPQVKMFMYHGLSDTTVPYENSVDTFNKLLSNGASTSVISLTPLEGTHSSAIEPYIADIIGKLLLLK
jgi:pimeloyl-ACP methyl ester carboxylesterase